MNKVYDVLKELGQPIEVTAEKDVRDSDEWHAHDLDPQTTTAESEFVVIVKVG